MSKMNTENSSRGVPPDYYNQHPLGVECIEIIRWYDTNTGNALKYLWRQGLKHEQGLDDKEKAIEDLGKAVFYMRDEFKALHFE